MAPIPLHRFDGTRRRVGLSNTALATSPETAFTLVEMLVAMAVLILIVVLVAQLTNSASNTIVNSSKHMDADAQARLVFGHMSTEFSKMLKRTDVDLSNFKQPGTTQGGNDHMAFFAEVSGYNSKSVFKTSQRSPISLVAYTVAQDKYSERISLCRMGKALGWDKDPNGNWEAMAYLPITIKQRWSDLFPTDPTAPPAPVTDPDYTTIGDQVFRFEYTYLIKPNPDDATDTIAGTLSTRPWDPKIPNHTSINGFKDVSAIVVAIAVLDAGSRVIVTEDNLNKMITQLPDAKDGILDPANQGDIAASWNAIVNAPPGATSFAKAAGIPQAAAAAVRVYQRTIYLDTQR